jgi:hypothetical protein
MTTRLTAWLAAAGIWVFLLSAVPVCAQISDIEAPQLVSINFAPNVVDVRATTQNVAVTADISDNLSGVSYAYVYFYSPSRNEYAFAYLNRTSGTPLSGIYSGTATFIPGMDAGAWLLDSFYAGDNAGNRRYLQGASLAAVQPARTLTVVSFPDTTKPLITGLRINPNTIDVSAGDQTLTIQFDFVDDVVGMSPNATYTFSPILKSPSGQQLRYGSGNQWTVLAALPPSTAHPGGGLTNATWQMQFVIPKSSEGGQWSLESIMQYDPLNRRWDWTTAELASSGLNPYFQVTSSNPDLTKPTLSDITISPGFVNTTLASQEVTVGVKIADNASGVIFDPTSTNISWYYGPYYNSPSGQQNNAVIPWAGPNAYRLVSGTSLNGSWQGKFTLPRYAEAGTWKISSIRVKDRVNNELFLNQSQIEAMGLQRTIVVTQPSGMPDNAIDPVIGGTVVDDVFGTKAQITAPPGVLSAMTTVSIDVFRSPLSVPTPVGFSAPGTLFVNISLNPHPAGLLPAPGLTVTLPVAGVMTPGTVLTLYRIDPATGTLVAARSVTGGSVTGAVDPDGQTATFTGIAALSTVVALVPTGAVVGDANLDGIISCLDYATIKQAFGKRRGQAGYLASADLNNDGLISVNDLMVVARLLPAGCPAN